MCHSPFYRQIIFLKVSNKFQRYIEKSPIIFNLEVRNLIKSLVIVFIVNFLVNYKKMYVIIFGILEKRKKMKKSSGDVSESLEIVRKYSK